MLLFWVFDEIKMTKKCHKQKRERERVFIFKRQFPKEISNCKNKNQRKKKFSFLANETMRERNERKGKNR